MTKVEVDQLQVKRRSGFSLQFCFITSAVGKSIVKAVGDKITRSMTGSLFGLKINARYAWPIAGSRGTR
jgi:hypothetical protein